MFYAKRGKFEYYWDVFVYKWNRCFKGEIPLGMEKTKMSTIMTRDYTTWWNDIRNRWLRADAIPPFINVFYWDGFFNWIKFEVKFIFWILGNWWGANILSHKLYWKPNNFYWRRFLDWFPQYLIAMYMVNSTVDLYFCEADLVYKEYYFFFLIVFELFVIMHVGEYFIDLYGLLLH